jgi:hypothetical protein
MKGGVQQSILAIAFILIILLNTQLIIALPGTAQVNEGSSTHLPTTTISLQAGNITQKDVNETQSTTRWAGIYGNISGNILLGDSSSQYFFTWTLSTINNSLIYASNSSITDWSNTNIVIANNSHMPSFISLLALDNYTNTFNQTESFTTPEYTITNAPFTRTWQNGSEGDFKTYSLRSISDSALIWATKANEGAQSFVSGQQTDYQLIVPAQQGTGTTYSLYVELI